MAKWFYALISQIQRVLKKSHAGAVMPNRLSRLLTWGPGTLFVSLLVSLPSNAAGPTTTGRQLEGTYTATAYSQAGITASGQYTHRHIVAADPDVLPIGSRIRIRRAGRLSGEYVVADTGRK